MPRAWERENEGELPAPRNKRGLREGYTTGSCAAASAKAATVALLRQQPVETVTIHLPIGREASFVPVEWRVTPDEAHCGIVKDAGDDPDVTHGALICATVAWRGEPGLEIRGGKGVGVVTQPGLGLEVGGPAINPVPRKMITASVAEAAGEWLKARGLVVTISVPKGEELAKKTTNPRLGIVGGLSILGTKGIVKPYSTASWRASVVQGIQVAAANGCEEVVLSTGGRTEKFAKQLRPDLPGIAFVEMGIFPGAALKTCVRTGIRKATFAGMVGKLSKMAKGHMQTHVAGNRVETGFLAAVAAECGASPTLQAEIRQANTARHFQEICLAHGLIVVFERLCELVCEKGFDFVKGVVAVEEMLFDFDGAVLGRARRGS